VTPVPLSHDLSIENNAVIDAFSEAKSVSTVIHDAHSAEQVLHSSVIRRLRARVNRWKETEDSFRKSLGNSLGEINLFEDTSYNVATSRVLLGSLYQIARRELIAIEVWLSTSSSTSLSLPDVGTCMLLPAISF
jgi:hypothetical protein